MALSDSDYKLSLLSIKELEAKPVLFYRNLLDYDYSAYHLQSDNKRELNVEILRGYILAVTITTARKEHEYRCDLSEVEWAGEYNLKHYKVK